MLNKCTDMFVVTPIGGIYHDYLLHEGLIKPNQYAVIKFSQFTKWCNDIRFINNYAKVVKMLPAPSFIGDTYEIALNVANELNETANQLTNTRKAGQK